MTRRRFLALFGGLLAAVTAAFPVLRRRSATKYVGWDLATGPDRSVWWVSPPDGLDAPQGETVYGIWLDETPPAAWPDDEPWGQELYERRDMEAAPGLTVAKLREAKAILMAGNQCGKTNAARGEFDAMIKDAFYHGNRLEL